MSILIEQYEHNILEPLQPVINFWLKLCLPVLMDDHKEAEAIEELSRAIDFKPDLQLLHLRAAFYDSMGDFVSAVRDCEAALCLDPIHNEILDLCNKAREHIREPKWRNQIF